MGFISLVMIQWDARKLGTFWDDDLRVHTYLTVCFLISILCKSARSTRRGFRTTFKYFDVFLVVLLTPFSPFLYSFFKFPILPVLHSAMFSFLQHYWHKHLSSSVFFAFFSTMFFLCHPSFTFFSARKNTSPIVSGENIMPSKDRKSFSFLVLLLNMCHKHTHRSSNSA